MVLVFIYLFIFPDSVWVLREIGQTDSVPVLQYVWSEALGLHHAQAADPSPHPQRNDPHLGAGPQQPLAGA